MDSIRVPSPVPSDGSFSTPFTTNYSPLAGSLPSATQSSSSHGVGAHQRQMPWTSSTSADSSWSNASAGNAFISSSQYHHLLAQFNESQRENASLLTKNVALETKVETLMMAYNMLLTHIPATSTPYRHVALRRGDYPKVRFWTRQDWNLAQAPKPKKAPQPQQAPQPQVLEVEQVPQVLEVEQAPQVLDVDQPEEVEVSPELDEDDDGSQEPSPSPGPAPARGKHRSSQGINVTMKYIELEDGTVVDGFRAAEIRRFARTLWVQMALDDKLPVTWSEIDATSLATYNESMAQRFIELRLCAADWKANLLAVDNYHSWLFNWLKKKNTEGEGKRPADSHFEVTYPTTKKAKVLPESAPVPVPSQEGFYMSIPQPTPHYDLNFTIGNPLALNSNAQLTNFTAFHQPAALVPYHSLAPSTEAFTPAAANLPSTSALPSLATANDGPKRSKGTTRMRPTKTTTARNLCALEWVKNNLQGTTDEFKAYYNNLSEEQKQVWEDKSKAAS